MSEQMTQEQKWSVIKSLPPPTKKSKLKYKILIGSEDRIINEETVKSETTKEDKTHMNLTKWNGPMSDNWKK